MPQNQAAIDLADTVRRAERGARAARQIPRHVRGAILREAERIVLDRQELLARVITRETGKTIRQSLREVSRCANTLKLSAHEAENNIGEMIPFAGNPSAADRMGWFEREPLGIIAAITPYNDPLNLVAHKLGPAIAGGNAIILKPSETAPDAAYALVDILTKAGLPQDVVTVVRGGADVGEALVCAPQVRMVSFTGGFAVGESIARAAGLKRLAMDLGGNAPVIVMDDCDLSQAVSACVSGAFWASGQNCIGTQKLLVQDEIFDEFVAGFLQAVSALRVGDPWLHTTDVGPMVTQQAAMRVEHLVAAAIDDGARCLAGNVRCGAIFMPTVLIDCPHHCRIWREEIFGPVVIIEKFAALAEAVSLANELEYGLHAAIFTNDLTTAFTAARAIEAGGVMINDSSDFRLDAMPFGGVKRGSMGREGVRFAYEEMTQPKVICFKSPTGPSAHRPPFVNAVAELSSK